MSMSIRRPEKLIITWASVLFAITVVICYLFIGHKRDIIAGLAIGALIGILKFLFNSYNFSKILTNGTPNVFALILLNLFNLALLFLILYLLLTKLNLINLYTAAGIFIGVGFIPLVILVGGILQSLYIIRDKF